MALVSLSSGRDADFLSGVTEVVEAGGVEWESHWIGNWSLVLTFRGSGRISSERIELAVGTGDLVLIAPQMAHRFSTEGEWVLGWVHFLMRPHLVLNWPECAPGIRCCTLSGPDFRRSRAALLEAHRLDFRRAANWYPLAYTLVESVLLRGGSGVEGGAEVPGGEWIPMAQKMLLSSPEISIDQVAARCGMSRTKFYVAFRQATGISPRAYRELQQLRRAQLLLENTSLPIAEIARQTGMDDPFYFSTRFRRFCGCSPSEFRSATSRDEA